MEQNVSRRGLIGAAIGTGAAAALSPSIALGRGRGHGHGHGHGDSDSVPRHRRGMQMWTVRRLTPDQAGARRVLRALGAMGYTEIEKFQTYGWTVEQFKRELRAAGLRCPSGHDGPGFPGTIDETAYRASLEYAVELGQHHTGLAWWPGPYNQEALWHQLAAHLNKAGRIAAEYDLEFFYHNHDFEFTNRFNGRPAYDILLEETDPEFVKFELDIYWIVEGGESPVHYLSDDPARFPLYHVKDHTWRDRPNQQDWEDAGPGSIDFVDVFQAGDHRGADKHFIIEHDEPLLSHPDRQADAELVTARVGIEFLKNVRW